HVRGGGSKAPGGGFAEPGVGDPPPHSSTTEEDSSMTRTLTAALAVGLLAVASHAAAQPPAKKPAADKARGKELFDGKSLDGWKAADYTGGGKVVVKDGAIVMELGEAMTGVVYRRGDFPKTDYEVSLEGK